MYFSSRTLLFFLMVMLLLAPFQCLEHQILRVGASLSLSGNSSRSPLGLAVRDGLQFFNNWYAQQPDFIFDGVPYRLEIEILDDAADPAIMKKNYETMLASNNYSYFLGPINSDFAAVARDLLDGRTLLLHTAASTNSVSVGSISTYSIIPPSSNHFLTAFLPSRLAGARSWSFIVEDSLYPRSVCFSAIKHAQNSGLGPPVCNITVPNSQLGIDGLTKIYQQAIEQISHCKQDIVAICSYFPVPALMINHAQAIDFSPGQFLISPVIRSYDNWTNNLWVSGYQIWSEKLNYPDDGFFGTPQQFADDFASEFGYRPDGYNAAGAAVGLYLWHAVSNALSPHWQDVSYALSRTDLQTFWGRLYYAGDHTPLADAPICQWQLPPIGQTIVAPLAGQADPLVFPFPLWSQRTEQIGWFHYPGDVIMTVLASLAIIFSLFILVLVTRFRYHPVIVASQLEFSIIILVGSILSYASIFTWLYYVSDVACATLPWLMSTGFVLIFAALLSKTWRVYWIYRHSQSFRRVSVSIRGLMFFIFVLLTLTWLLLIPWTILDPLKAVLVIRDPVRPSLDYVDCQMGMTGTGFLIAIICTMGVLLLLATYVTFLTRNVEILSYREARFIGFALYNQLIISTALVACIAAQLGPKYAFWLRTLGILVGTMLTVCCLFLPKVYFLYKEGFKSTQSPSSRVSSQDQPPTDSSINSGKFTELESVTHTDTSELQHQLKLLQSENQLLRTQLTELRQRTVT